MHGFTLVELVIVILLVGIMATFTSQFIGISSQIYIDAASREQLMSDARFLMERLNRELRDAVPGSVRIEDHQGNWTDKGPCVRFWPISASSHYLSLNVEVTHANPTFELVMVTPALETDPFIADGNAVQDSDRLIVFPIPDQNSDSLMAGCKYGGCVAMVTDVMAPVSGIQTIRYSSVEMLAGRSPGNRIYFAREQVRYCVEGNYVTRSRAGLEDSLPTTGVLMAESLNSGSFYREPMAFNTEGVFGIRFVFARRGESVTFNHKIGVRNVP
ncbi:PilW family protein [Aeromonas hydrophila]|uniref:PilW family protein n=1 Tax=Aeromonas hydrophila TaxID=644 RepID=UPI002AC34B95|nr:type II secretion system protein [Aeromonas hydrophila]